jgi:hypothetical protein
MTPSEDSDKQKRFKVGRACYTCRQKKIKVRHVLEGMAASVHHLAHFTNLLAVGASAMAFNPVCRYDITVIETYS